MRKLRQITLMILLTALTASVTAFAQTKTEEKTDTVALPATDLERIKPGVAAPDFTLADESGKQVTLANHRGKKTVVLVFYRGYW